MNNKAHLRPKDYDSNGDIIPMSWKEEQGDLISRKYLKDQISELFSHDDAIDIWIKRFDVEDLIDNAPTVCGNNPKWCESCVSKGKCASTRPHGEWIGINRDCRGYCDTFKCSICGAYIYPYTVVKELDYNGCPYCFADMRGAE